MALTDQFNSAKASCGPLDHVINLLIASQFMLFCEEFRATQELLGNYDDLSQLLYGFLNAIIIVERR
jgi:hypothetical protein